MWCDGEKYRKPTALPANEYVSNLMEWVEKLINDENIFPVNVGKYGTRTSVTHQDQME